MRIIIIIADYLRSVWEKEVPKHKPRLLLMNKYCFHLSATVSLEIESLGRYVGQFSGGLSGVLWGTGGVWALEAVWMLSGPRLWGFSVIAINRCDLEGQSEGGVTLEALEKASKELGFEDFLRYTNMQNMHALCCVVRH